MIVEVNRIDFCYFLKKEIKKKIGDKNIFHQDESDGSEWARLSKAYF